MLSICIVICIERKTVRKLSIHSRLFFCQFSIFLRHTQLFRPRGYVFLLFIERHGTESKAIPLVETLPDATSNRNYFFQPQRITAQSNQPNWN